MVASAKKNGKMNILITYKLKNGKLVIGVQNNLWIVKICDKHHDMLSEVSKEKNNATKNFMTIMSTLFVKLQKLLMDSEKLIKKFCFNRLNIVNANL